MVAKLLGVEMTNMTSLQDLFNRAVEAASKGAQIDTVKCTWEDGSVTQLPVMDRGADWACGVER